MKKKLFLLLSLVVSCLSLKAGVEHLLPKPQQLTVTAGGGNFSLQSVALNCPETNLTTTFTEWITNECGGTIDNSGSQKITVTYVNEVPGAEFQDEAYSLEVTASEITIKSKNYNGAFWALQTLAQLTNGTDVPAVSILDWPAFRIRGYMQDAGRSFIAFEELKKQVKLLSRYKINIFHWHLTEYQAWRLESKLYPQLNEAQYHTRHAGQYYTIAQAKEMQEWCKQHGMTIIPEIEMPGHSDCFTRTFGFGMQTTQGLEIVKKLLEEACETFDQTPWMHIGTDETPITLNNFVPEVTALLHSKNRLVGSWHPGNGTNPDMIQLWGSGGTITPGVMNIDSRYHYLNHYDMFADIAGIYASNILGAQKQTNDLVGFIGAVWNDRLLPTQKDIVYQNQFYAAILAMGERGWMGGGVPYTKYGVTIPPVNTKEYGEFVDWERRFLHWKESHLKDEPIPYVKQTHVKWRITDAFPNSGNLETSFPPEKSLETKYVVDGKTYNTKLAIGSEIVLRHFWGETLNPGFYKAPQANTTAYAYTWVYSPTEQTVGAWIETQNYGRADLDLAPKQGKWDYKESLIWINNQPVAPPTWINTHTETGNYEIALQNENFTARKAIPVTLNAGWNKVLLRLPIGGFKGVEVKRNKWMFAFAFVTPDEKKEVEGLIWSPDKNMNPLIDNLRMILDDADEFRSKITIGEGAGLYPLGAVLAFDKAIAETKQNIENIQTEEEVNQAIAVVTSELTKLKGSTSDDAFIYSDESRQAYYKFYTPLRSKFCLTDTGDGVAMTGKVWSDNNGDQMWKLVKLADGSCHMISKNGNRYMNPEKFVTTNAVIATAETPSKGWRFLPAKTQGLYILTCGTVQINQGGKGPILNWGGGANTTDLGCQYQIELVATVPEETSAPLKAAISTTMNFMNKAVIGIQPGEYPEQANTALIEALNQAITVWQSNPNKEQSDAATVQMETAFNTFKATLIVPMGSNNQKTYWYSMHTPNRGYFYVTSKGVNADLMGESKVSETPSDAQLWKLVPLNDGSYSLVDKASGCYISPNSGVSTPLKTLSDTQASGGWKITPTGIDKYFIITSSTVQFNQQWEPFKVLNWGSGANTTDTGCQYVVKLEKTDGPVSIDKPQSEQLIWIENRTIRSIGITEPIEIYNISGQKINTKERLPQGLFIGKAGSYTQYVVSK